MKVTSYTTPDVFDELQPEWNALLQNSATDTPFSTFEWNKLWWEAYHPGDLWVLTFRDEDDETLLGIAALFIATGDSGKREVHFIGCEDVTDYLDIIAHRDYLPQVYEALVQTLLENRDKYNVLDLCNIPQGAATCSQFADMLRTNGYEVEVNVQEVCPVIYLPDTFDDYLQLLDKKQRKEVQRKLRQAEGLSDSINFYIVDDSHNLDDEIDNFLDLMAASHPEKAAFLEDEQHVQFFKTLVPAAYDAGWLQLNFLEVTGSPIAAYVNFDYNNRILVYNSGLNPDKAYRLGAGIILLAYNIQHAIEQEREVFDFLRGDEQYKYRMGGSDTEVFNLYATFSGSSE